MRRFTRVSAWAVALSAALLAGGAPLWASSSTAQVPEIAAGSISAGLGLLAAGVLMLRARRAK